jgi:hypothetical protein
MLARLDPASIENLRAELRGRLVQPGDAARANTSGWWRSRPGNDPDNLFRMNWNVHPARPH